MGFREAWDIKSGYSRELNPCCPPICCGDSGTSGSTETLTPLLTEIRDSLEDTVVQTIITGTTAGTIPAGVQSYSIYNLGIDPTDPLSVANPMIINSIPLNVKVFSFENSGNKAISNAIPYDPNGNTLLIVYNV